MLNQKIKAIFVDIDGTILSHPSKTIPKSTVFALNKAREKGIKVFTCTGRNKMEMEDLPLDEITFDGHVSINGAYCFSEGKDIFHNPIKKEDANKMLELINDNDIATLIVEKDKMYMTKHDEVSKKSMDDINTPLAPISAKDYLDQDVYVMVLFSNENIWERLVASFDNNLNYVSWHDNAADVFALGTDKLIGLNKMLEYFNIDQDQVIAFGDGSNDIDMIKGANIGVAMGNAVDEVKKVSDYVTDHIDNDGLYKALVYFKVIEDDLKLVNN